VEGSIGQTRPPLPPFDPAAHDLRRAARRPLTDDDPTAIEARVAQLVADNVEHARLKAYDELGDGRRALTIAVRWLRPKVLAQEVS
jgi:hypothetical protein